MPSEKLVKLVTEAMQDAWNAYCDDTDCFPDCFQHESRGQLSANFNRGPFASAVASNLTRNIALVDAGEGWMPKVGDQVHVSNNSAYHGDWHGVDATIIAISMMQDRSLNYTIVETENFPHDRGCDGWKIEELEPWSPPPAAPGEQS